MMNTYEVVVKQTLVQYKVLEVEAMNEDEASDIGERDAASLSFWSWTEVEANDIEVISVEPAGQHK
jgi:hypothetical protein